MQAEKIRSKVPVTRTNIAKKVAVVAAGYPTVPAPAHDPDHVPSNDRASLVDLVHAIVDPSEVNPTGTRLTVSIEATNHQQVVVVIRSVVGTTVRTMATRADGEEQILAVAAVIPAVVVRETAVVQAAR